MKIDVSRFVKFAATACAGAGATVSYINGAPAYSQFFSLGLMGMLTVMDFSKHEEVRNFGMIKMADIKKKFSRTKEEVVATDPEYKKGGILSTSSLLTMALALQVVSTTSNYLAGTPHAIQFVALGFMSVVTAMSHSSKENVRNFGRVPLFSNKEDKKTKLKM